MKRAQAILHRISRQKTQFTDILNYSSSMVFLWRAILEELILRIALAPGAIFSSILPALPGVYWKIYS